MWSGIYSCFPIHFLIGIATNWDIIDLIFVGWCAFGFLVSLIVHIVYQLMYPKGTESRDLWSPVETPCETFAIEAIDKDCIPSKESCQWLNYIANWLYQEHNCASNSLLSQFEKQYLLALNQATVNKIIKFCEFSFENAPPQLTAATSQLSSDRKHVLLRLRFNASQLRFKLQLRHSASVYEVLLMDFGSEAISQLQFEGSQGTATLALIGQPIVRGTQVREVHRLEGSTAPCSHDWLASQIITVITSAVANFQLSGPLPLLANTDAECQTDGNLSYCIDPATTDLLAADGNKQRFGYPDEEPVSTNENTLWKSKSNVKVQDPIALPTEENQINYSITENPCCTTGIPASQNSQHFGMTATNQDEANFPAKQNLLTSCLHVKVIRASGLVADHGRDPQLVTVVSLELDNLLEFHKTGAAYGITNPYWEQDFLLNLSPSSKYLTVKLLRQPRSSADGEIRPDSQAEEELVGTACLQLSELPACGARVLLPMVSAAGAGSALVVTLEMRVIAGKSPGETTDASNMEIEAVEIVNKVRSRTSELDGPRCLYPASCKVVEHQGTQGLTVADTLDPMRYSSPTHSIALSLVVNEFMEPLEPTEQPIASQNEATSTSSSTIEANSTWRMSDYSYVREFEKQKTMQFQMTYKKPKASRGIAVLERIGRVLLKGTTANGRGRRKW